MTETAPATLYCYVHPTRETTLRCKRCERPICASCAVLTPTGYLCKDCVRSHQKAFDTAEWIDYVLGFITAGLLSALTSFLVSLIGGFGIFGWLLIAAGAPAASGVIAEGVRYATRRHRSRPLFITVGAGVVLGALPIVLFQVLSMNLFGILFQIIYLVIAVPFIYTRLSGIQLFR
jgi:hypothetical protein